jgi:hypothetical protein
MNNVFRYKLALPAIPIGALIWGAAELVALQWSKLRGAFKR